MSRRSIYLLLAPIVIAVIVFGVSRISFNVEILDVLPKSIDNVKALKVYREHFSSPNKLVITISSPDAEKSEQVTETLVTQLQEDGLIGATRWRSEVEEDADAWAEVMAYLWMNSEPEVFDDWAAGMLTEESREQRLGAQMERLAEPMMTADAESFALQYDPYGLLRHPFLKELMKGEGAGGDQFISQDGTFRVAFASLPREFAGYPETKEWLAEVESAVDGILAERGWEDVEIGYTGEPPYVVEISSMMENDMSSSMGWTITIVVLLFWVMQRRVMPLLVLAVALGIVFGITLAVGGTIYGELNIMSIGFAAILVGLAADYGVLISQYEGTFHGNVRSIRKALMPSILWAATTTAAVFFALNFSQFPGVAQLGTLVAAGILAGALVMLTAYAEVICWLGGKMNKRKHADEEKAGIQPAPVLVRKVIRGGRWVTAGVAVVAVSVLLWLGMPNIDYRLRSMEDMPLESMDAFMEIRERVGSWSPDHLPVVVDSDSMEKTGASLDELKQKTTRLEEEGVLEDSVVPSALWPDPENQQSNLAMMRKVLEQWEAAEADADEIGFSEEALVLARNVIASWEKWSKSDAELFVPDSHGAKDAMRRFIVFEDEAYAALALITPKDYEAAKEREFRDLGVLNTEHVHLAAWESLRMTIRNLLIYDATHVLLPLVGVLCVMLVVVFRNVKDVLLSATAIIVAGVLLNAWMALTGQEWNFQSLAAVPVLLGTGLDFVIHVVLALRRYNNDESQYWRGTGKAVVFCGFTTATGFGSLAFATDPGLAQLGSVCASGILTMMVVAVFLLPGWRRQAMSV